MKSLAKDVEKALEAARLYLGCDSLPLKTQTKFYNRMLSSIRRVAEKRDADAQDIFDQIQAKARSLGALSPRPGKDY